MSFELMELSEVGGAEVRGLDVSATLTPDTVAALDAAFDKYAVLLFREQPLSARQLADFGRCFGPIQPHVQRAYQHPQVPEVVMMTSVNSDGSFDDAGARRGAIENTRDGWHSDLSYDPVPAKATLLHAIELPSHGGNTCFCNAARAYASLDENFKEQLDGLTAQFTYGGNARNKSTAVAASALDQQGQATAHAVHPVVSGHATTGLPAIYVNPLMTTRILGVSQAMSEAILERLFDALDDHSVRFEHQWRLNDTLLWDNRGGLLHTGRLDYPRAEPRRFIRTTVSGAPIRGFRRTG
jgi:taurine dioxygenase